jgi:hypothetical protein
MSVGAVMVLTDFKEVSVLNFSQIAKEMNEVYTKVGKMPIGIKVNPYWFEKQLQQTFILRKSNENPLETFTGLPVHEDNSIDTYEFVYRDDK